MTSADLEKKFVEIFGEGAVISAKVSINPDHSSRMYGFVHFKNSELAAKAVTIEC